MRLLFDALVREVAEPLLEATTSEEFEHRLAECLGKFIETRTAYRVFNRQVIARPDVNFPEWLRAMRQKAEKLGGPEMADEFDFAASTCHRAVVLAKSLQRLPASVHRETRKRDRELAHEFSIFNHIFHCVQFTLYVASKGETVNSVALKSVFEILRGSALNSYSAVRQRVQLRRPPELVSLERLPFDDEDLRLASAS